MLYLIATLLLVIAVAAVLVAYHAIRLERACRGLDMPGLINDVFILKAKKLEDDNRVYL